MLAMPIAKALKEKKSKDVARADKRHGINYYRVLAGMWCSAIVVLIMSFIGGISLADIGFRAISFTHNIWFTAITLAICGLMLLSSLYTLIVSLASKKFRGKKKAELTNDDVANDILPRTTKEKWLFALMSFSSGICEEFVFRGFMMFLLLAIFPEIPIFLIVLIPSVIFGIGHLYQGWQGVIQTGVVGAILMCLFLATDSLIPVMALHFMLNVSDMFLLSEKKEDKPSLHL